MAFDGSLPTAAAPGVEELRPYQPGKPIETLQRELGLTSVVKLASNENPLGYSQFAQEALMNGLERISRYPDGNGFLLKQALVSHFEAQLSSVSIDSDNITLGNGSNDVLELIARAFLTDQDHAIYSEYSFAVYRLVCKAVNASVTEVPATQWGHDLPAIADAITDRTKVIFLANPNNPTGTYFKKQAFETFLAAVPSSVLVVLDEAYCEYLEDADYPDGLTYLANHPNLIVTRTFSKAYGLSGLRVGYSVSSAVIADYLNRVRQPFNVNELAQLAAVAALGDQVFVAQSRAMNAAGLAQCYQQLSKLELSWIPSAGNFVCVKFAKPAMPIYEALLKQGVITRPVDNYGLPHFLRVSIGLPQEQDAFFKALQSLDLTDYRSA